MKSTQNIPELSASQIEDLRLAASKMNLVSRRNFQAEITLKYCNGNARQAEYQFGWGRATIELGLAEKRTGILCIGAQSGYSGAKRWEEKHPAAASALRVLVESQSQQESTFQSSISYTRLTAKSALEALRLEGFSDEVLPSASGMSVILNRMGYRLRKVLKAKPQKSA